MSRDERVIEGLNADEWEYDHGDPRNGYMVRVPVAELTDYREVVEWERKPGEPAPTAVELARDRRRKDKQRRKEAARKRSGES